MNKTVYVVMKEQDSNKGGEFLLRIFDTEDGARYFIMDQPGPNDTKQCEKKPTPGLYRSWIQFNGYRIVPKPVHSIDVRAFKSLQQELTAVREKIDDSFYRSF